METATLEMKELIETPVAPGIVRRSDRGLCIANSRIPVFDIMDYLNAGWSREMLLEYVAINEEQLQHALDFIKQGGAELEAAHAEFTRKADEMEREYREREKQRQAELKAKGLWGKPPDDPRLLPAWEKLQAWKRERAPEEDEG
jgi:uncharacterized protein (DUF433 family)